MLSPKETHAELEAACNELCLRLRARAALWRRFERQLELVQGAVREADYMAELLTVQGQVDYDRLLKATEKLEVLTFKGKINLVFVYPDHMLK